MGNKADDILAELEDLGATGNEPILPLKAIEEVNIEKGHPSPLLLDERGERMVQLADTLIDEFDRFINSATIMKVALQEMRTMWRPSSAPAQEAPEEPESDEPSIQELLAGEDLEEAYAEHQAEEEDLVEEPAEEPVLGQGKPNAMGDIQLTVPAPVPLPPDVENLE